jgi:hypothetical protein
MSEKKIRTWHVVAFTIFALFVLAFFEFKIAKHYPQPGDLSGRGDYFGTTFSKKFCQELGLDWREVYLAMLDDLNVKQIRLPIYWDDIEKSHNSFDFSDYDYMIREGDKRGVKFILSIGWRLPRWPECHAPSWTGNKNMSAVQVNLLNSLRQVVNRYKDNPAVEYWQVENEPFLNTFGICPKLDEDFFEKEVDLVKELDGRKVLISASGELSSWKREAELGDVFGTTIYRVVWNQFLGYVRYPIPSWVYRFKAFLVGIKPENRFIIELQAEPWSAHGGLNYLSENDSMKSMNLDQLKANAQFAINTGFARSYFWGVEWWYWKKINGDSSFWDLGRQMFSVK